MIERAYGVLDRLANRRGLVILLAATVAWSVVMRIAGAMLGLTTGGLDTRVLGYSPEEAVTILEAMGSQGRQHYALFEASFDVVFPMLYGTLLEIALVLACRRGGRTRRSVILVPLSIVILDWTENATIIAMIVSFNSQVQTFASVSATVTVMKWWMLFLAYVPLLVNRYFDQEAKDATTTARA